MRVLLVIASTLIALALLLSSSELMSAASTYGPVTQIPPAEFVTTTPTPIPSPTPARIPDTPTPLPSPTPIYRTSEFTACVSCGGTVLHHGAAAGCASRVNSDAGVISMTVFCTSAYTDALVRPFGYHISGCPHGFWAPPDCPTHYNCNWYTYTTFADVPGATGWVYHAESGPGSGILEIATSITVPEGCDYVRYFPHAVSRDGIDYAGGIWQDCWDPQCDCPYACDDPERPCCDELLSPCAGKSAGVYWAGCPGGREGQPCPRGSGIHDIAFRFGANWYVQTCGNGCSSYSGGSAWVDVLCVSGPLSGTWLFGGGGCAATHSVLVTTTSAITVKFEESSADFSPLGAYIIPPNIYILPGGVFTRSWLFNIRHSSLLNDRLDFTVRCPVSVTHRDVISIDVNLEPVLTGEDCRYLIPEFHIPSFDLFELHYDGYSFPGVVLCVRTWRIKLYLFPYGDFWNIADRLLTAMFVLALVAIIIRSR